jgi:competence protein ComEC
MIATHVHEDHVGGLVAVLNSTIIVDEILINNQTYPASNQTYVNFLSLAKSHNVTPAWRGQIFRLTETVNLTVFNPVQPLEFPDTDDSDHTNDNSVVVKLQAGNTSFLLTGDAEAHAEQTMLSAGLNLRSNVLKVGHHGSNTSTTQKFLDSILPSYAIISAGKNDPKHPDPEVIQRLLAKGVTIYGTFQSETIIASTDGTSITFQGNPQPVIPEFPSSIILSLFMMATLLTAFLLRKRVEPKTPRISPAYT